MTIHTPLNRENLQDWKGLLTKLIQEKYAILNYDSMLNDEEWIFSYCGLTVEEAFNIDSKYLNHEPE